MEACDMQQHLAHDGHVGASKRLRTAEGERRCIVTRQRRDRAELIRLVVDPDGCIVPDLAESLPGRGLWLTARREMVQTACDNGVLARMAVGSVTVPPALGDRIEELLAKRCVDTLGLARRAGQVASGFQAVREWVRGGRTALLLTAADSRGEDGRALRRGAAEIRWTGVLTSAELGRALGRDMLVHVAVAPGRLADSLYRDSARLSGFRAAAQDPDGDRFTDCCRKDEQA